MPNFRKAHLLRICCWRSYHLKCRFAFCLHNHLWVVETEKITYSGISIKSKLYCKSKGGVWSRSFFESFHDYIVSLFTDVSCHLINCIVFWGLTICIILQFHLRYKVVCYSFRVHRLCLRYSMCQFWRSTCWQLCLISKHLFPWVCEWQKIHRDKCSQMCPVQTTVSSQYIVNLRMTVMRQTQGERKSGRMSVQHLPIIFPLH